MSLFERLLGQKKDASPKVNAVSIREHAISLVKKEQFEDGITELKKAIELGDLESYYWLGQLYDIINDIDSSVRWYIKGADRNEIHCLEQVARAYFFGEGVSPDTKRAISYAQKGSNLGSDDCQCVLALIYQLGSDDFKPDYEKAVYYHNLAAKQGNEISQITLGELYLFGECGVCKDEKRGLQMLKEHEDNPMVPFKLVKYYQSKKNDGMVFEWAVKGSKMEDSDCQIVAAMMYEDGSCGVKDIKTAYILYSKAAENGEPYGYYYKARIENEVLNNKKAARESLLNAVAGGCSEAGAYQVKYNLF